MQKRSSEPRHGLRILLAGVLVLVFAPALLGWASVDAARPRAKSIMRGSGGSHGMPGCSPPVAWTLAYLDPLPFALGSLSFVSFGSGVGMIIAGALILRKESRR